MLSLPVRRTASTREHCLAPHGNLCRLAGFWLYAFIGFKDPRSCLRVPSLGISYRDSATAPSADADAENRISNAGIRRIGFPFTFTFFHLRDIFCRTPPSIGDRAQ